MGVPFRIFGLSMTTISRSSLARPVEGATPAADSAPVQDATPVVPAAIANADSFVMGTRNVAKAVKNGGLPDVLLSSANATVVHGKDPGNFYCEHMFFVAQREANQPGSCVLTNSCGEKLVGFLHIPMD